MIEANCTDHAATTGNRIHRVLAALICHQEKKSPYAAILCTGTSHKDTEVCGNGGSHGTCDGHAESIIYEAAPKYFMNEMASVLKEEENESIFELLPYTRGFKLKPNVKFYLMVTGPPCGFIQDQKDPCMEWKIPFVGFPHVPTCSSRILIGATMGIQGYVSHLLEESIMIDSVIILCSKDVNVELQKAIFDKSFPLPNIKTMKYNPRDFRNFEPDYSPKQGENSTPITKHSTPLRSTSGENITARLNSSGSDGHNYNESSLTVTCSDRNEGSSFLTFNPRTGQQNSRISGFLITKRDVDISIIINDNLKLERRLNMEKLYTDLCKKLELEKALKRLQDKLVNDIKMKCSEISSMMNSASTTLNKTLTALGELLQSARAPDNTISLDKTAAEQRWIEHSQSIKEKIDTIEEDGIDTVGSQIMIMCIKDILSRKKEIIMDCSWHCYLFTPPENNQPTD